MKLVWGTAVIAAFASGGVLSLTSCEKIQSSLNDFAGNGGPEALPESESLAGAEGLPVVTSFATIAPNTFASFTAAGDRISVVEFYSDT